MKSRSNSTSRPMQRPRMPRSMPAKASSSMISRGRRRARRAVVGGGGGEERQVEGHRLLAAGGGGVAVAGQRLPVRLAREPAQDREAVPAAVVEGGQQVLAPGHGVPGPGGPLDARFEEAPSSRRSRPRRGARRRGAAARPPCRTGASPSASARHERRRVMPEAVAQPSEVAVHLRRPGRGRRAGGRAGGRRPRPGESGAADSRSRSSQEPPPLGDLPLEHGEEPGRGRTPAGRGSPVPSRGRRGAPPRRWNSTPRSASISRNRSWVRLARRSMAPSQTSGPAPPPPPPPPAPPPGPASSTTPPAAPPAPFGRAAQGEEAGLRDPAQPFNRPGAQALASRVS